jgi:hypothetical protein
MAHSVAGDRLLDLIRGTSGPVVLVAPFVKTAAFQRVLSAIDEARPIILVTRWRIEEICVGVSDVDVWRIIEQRGNSLMLLSNFLHAKYYRSENSVLIGSANITLQGLGWASRSNIELLERVEASPALISFENELIGSGTRVDSGLYEKYAAFKPEPTEPIELAKNDELDPNLVPLSRNPDRLWGLYAAGILSSNSVIDADSLRDLRVLAIPLGLSKKQFEGFVAMWLLNHPLGQRLDDYILIPRRFGEIRDLVRDYGCVPGDDRDPTEIAQVIMRWMLYFFPERYELNQPRHSEIFSRRIG